MYSRSSAAHPGGLRRAVGGQPPPQRRGDHEREDALDEEQDAPVAPGQDPAGQRRGDDRGDGDVHHPEPVGPGPLARREPVADQHQDGGPDAALGDAEQEAHDEQLGVVLHQARGEREHAPDQDHDPDELLRAPPLGQVPAGDLQDQVADEEDAPGQALRRRVEVQVLAHPVEREADVGPVHERDDVDDDRHRNQPGPARPAGRCGNSGCSGCHDQPSSRPPTAQSQPNGLHDTVRPIALR